MNKLRQSGYGRIPCVCGAVMVLLLPAGLAVATTVTSPVRVTFVEPIEIKEGSALQFGSVDQNLANLESVTVAPATAVTDLVDGSLQAAASLTITATPGDTITIYVDSVDPGSGYSLTDFRCNYNAGAEGACDSAGYSETSVASGNLLVGATLTSHGTSTDGVADGSLVVTIIYQ